jgi:hypothetical protein
MYKAEVTGLYNEGLEKNGIPMVSYKTFTILWNTLYPHCTIRSYVDVPGKCFICGEIDRLRQSTSCEQVHKALSTAHMMHRGGMVMPEQMM